jgi:hypothetical protein
MQQCRDWLSSNPSGPPPSELEPWMSSAWTGKARRIDLADCQRLREAVDDFCGFDSGAVEAFTQESVANGGDYTVGMWVRPVPLPDESASLHPDGRFYPSIGFLSSVSPPKPVLAFGIWANTDGEVRSYTKCPEASSPQPFENVEIYGAHRDGWTFLAITRVNSTWPAATKMSTFTGLRTFEEEALTKQCLFDPAHFFQVNLRRPLARRLEKCPLLDLLLHTAFEGDAAPSLGPASQD